MHPRINIPPAPALKRVAIHQPNLLPRLKVLQKLAAADLWVVLDNVQYCPREWQNRARLVALHGANQSFWLSIPVTRPQGRHTEIRDVGLVDAAAVPPLIGRTLIHTFRRSPHWNEVAAILDDMGSALNTRTLSALAVDTTLTLLRSAGFQPQVRHASSLNSSGHGSQLIASICEEVQGDIYLADSGALDYLNVNHFSKSKVLWQTWQPPASSAWPGIPSWRDISAINYLAREGLAATRAHLAAAPLVPTRPSLSADRDES